MIQNEDDLPAQVNLILLFRYLLKDSCLSSQLIAVTVRVTSRQGGGEPGTPELLGDTDGGPGLAAGLSRAGRRSGA